jgi:FKBP-type peptidyl-prolyl cis-trans isomerase
MKCLAVLSLLVGAALSDVEVTPSGLQIDRVSVPETCDKVAKRGNILSMHYTGTLDDGQVGGDRGTRVGVTLTPVSLHFQDKV